MPRKPKILAGRFDSQAIAEVETLNDTFSINVKDDEGAVIYTNKEEPYSYCKVPSLQTALQYFGAVLSEDQKQFLTEALAGAEETGKAVQKIIETINDSLKADAKSSAYAKVFNEKKPVTEESIGNAHARAIRSIMKTSGASDEVVYGKLRSIDAIPADYTLEMFRANKSKV